MDTNLDTLLTSDILTGIVLLVGMILLAVTIARLLYGLRRVFALLALVIFLTLWLPTTCDQNNPHTTTTTPGQVNTHDHP
jgi:hypothetical protein